MQLSKIVLSILQYYIAQHFQDEYQKSYKVFLKVIKSYFKLTDENASVVAD